MWKLRPVQPAFFCRTGENDFSVMIARLRTRQIGQPLGRNHTGIKSGRSLKFLRVHLRLQHIHFPPFPTIPNWCSLLSAPPSDFCASPGSRAVVQTLQKSLLFTCVHWQYSNPSLLLKQCICCSTSSHCVWGVASIKSSLPVSIL